MRYSCIDYSTSSIGLSVIRVILYTMSLTAATSFLLILVYLFCPPVIPEASSAIVRTNNRPIVGILSQEISYKLNRTYLGQYNSYIAASYVKFAEGAGARVVPIWIGKTREYYQNVLSEINGVIFPGGSTFFNQSNGYADAGKIIYDIAKEYNDNGDYFPIFGICLGFELLTYLIADCTEHRIDCSSQRQPLPLEFKLGFRKSRMFKELPTNIQTILETQNVTANFHRFCVTEEALRNLDLTNEIRVMSLNHDKNGVQFISTLEHKTYPFYGVQFHPEKNIYEWFTIQNIPHGKSATLVSQYFADFFVDEARKSRHKFSSPDEEATKLIYNYPVTYTGLNASTSFEQCYLFSASNTE